MVHVGGPSDCLLNELFPHFLSPDYSRIVEYRHVGATPCRVRIKTMTKGYWIVSIDVSDPEGYKLYVAENAKAFRKFGAKFLVRGAKPEVVEGTARSRNVVIEFRD